MVTKYAILLFCALFYGFVLGVEEIEDDEVRTWESPNPYTEAMSLAAVAEYGYRFQVTVKKMDLDGDCGDYLLIKQGTSEDDPGTGAVYTQIIKKPQTLVIQSQNLFMKLVAEPCTVEEDTINPERKSGFTLTYQRIGKVIKTTTENPTTLSTFPTPGPNDSIYVKVYISGKPIEDYDNEIVLNNLKTAISSMATEYCAANAMYLKEDITVENVIIKELKRCPYNWPDSNKCAEMTFALPVVLDSPDDGYQLLASHLRTMWSRYSEKYLKSYGMHKDSPPDIDQTLTMWNVLTAVTLVVFVLLISLFFIYEYCFRTRNKENDAHFDDGAQERNKKYVNMQTQIVPPFMENNYNYLEYDNQGYIHDDIADDSSDDEVPRNRHVKFNKGDTLDEYDI